MALLEAAASFGSVPDEAFAEIIETLRQSNKIRTQEKNQVINALSVYLAERTKFQNSLSAKDFPILTEVDAGK